MANFNKAYRKLEINEGGYANNLSDRGKETYKGVSRRYYPNWEGWLIVDSYKGYRDFPGILDSEPILQRQIEVFYYNEFWSKVNGTLIQNENIAFSIFDFAVNTGTNLAIKAMQRVLGLKEDGVIGVITLNAVNTVNEAEFMALYAITKCKHYISIVDKDATQLKYLKGWIKRAIYL
jgi:lysozyme family protein